MAVHIDSINTGTLEETPDGYRVEVEAIVTGVSGDIWQRRFNALRAPGLPPRGSQHPAEASIFLMERTVEPVDDSPSKWRIRMIYRVPSPNEPAPSGGRYGPTVWTGDATTYTEQTFRDVNGNPMLVGYQGRPTRVVVNQTDGSVVTKYEGGIGVLRLAEVATVDVDRPTLILRASRWERDIPEAAAERVVGATNRATFRAKGPKTVLCRGVRWEPTPEGGHTVSYEFAYRSAGWQANPTISNNGIVPQDARVGNGIEFYDVFPSADFAGLSL